MAACAARLPFTHTRTIGAFEYTCTDRVLLCVVGVGVMVRIRVNYGYGYVMLMVMLLWLG